MGAFTPLPTQLDSAVITVVNPILITLIDEASATVSYFGQAAPGSQEDSAVWSITKMEVVGNVTEFKRANLGAFDQIWDNRSSLTYS